MSCSLSLAHLLLSTSLLCTCALPEGTGPRAAEASPPLLFPPFSFLCIPPARTPASLQTPPPFLHSDCAERGTSGLCGSPRACPQPAVQPQLAMRQHIAHRLHNTACTGFKGTGARSAALRLSGTRVWGVCKHFSISWAARGFAPADKLCDAASPTPGTAQGGRGKHAGSKCTGFSSGSTLWFYNPSPCHEIQTPARARGQVCVGSARDAPSPWNQCAP